MHPKRTLKEFTAFGDEYSIDEIKSEADDMIARYVPKADIRSAKWQQSEHTHKKQVGDYSVTMLYHKIKTPNCRQTP